MYEDFYHLSDRPFELTPNPKFLLLTPGHREALSNLQYGIAARKGLTVITGDAGSGKTTLLRMVIGQIALGREPFRTGPCAYINNPALTRREFLETMAREFNLAPEAATSKARFLGDLERVLRTTYAAGGSAALIIDEAQSLPHDLLEEVRLLANIETDTVKLLPLVLAGQPELADRLNEPQLRQLKQRIALRCRLEPLDLQETGAYIATRIRQAGGDPAGLFTREAIEMIFERSRGIPRVISVLCDNALITGFALGEPRISADILAEVCRDFDFPAAAAGRTVNTLIEEPVPVEAGRPFSMLRSFIPGGRTH
jgi:general secretion pathway protein A